MKIKVYSTQQCPFCHMAKHYFNSRRIEFEDIDVSANREAAKEMIDKSGQIGVPVIEIDGQIIVGFDEPKLEKILSKKDKVQK